MTTFKDFLKKVAQSNTAMIPGIADFAAGYAQTKKPLFAAPVQKPNVDKPRFSQKELIARSEQRRGSKLPPVKVTSDPWTQATQQFKALGNTRGFKNLTQAIAARNKMQRGSAEYNQVQSLINQAYGKRPAQTVKPVQAPAPTASVPAAQAISVGKQVAQTLLGNPGMTAKPGQSVKPVQRVKQAPTTSGFSPAQSVQGRAENAFGETDAEYAARQERLKKSPWMQGKRSDLTLDIDKGDLLLGGKFKNKPVVVEEFGTDNLGQPTVNGRSLLTHRINKNLPEDKQRKESSLIEESMMKKQAKGKNLARALKAMGLAGLGGLAFGAGRKYDPNMIGGYLERQQGDTTFRTIGPDPSWSRDNNGLGYSGPYAEGMARLVEEAMKNSKGKLTPYEHLAQKEKGESIVNKLNDAEKYAEPRQLGRELRDFESLADPSSSLLGENAGVSDTHVWNPEVEDIRSLLLSKNNPYMIKTEALKQAKELTTTGRKHIKPENFVFQKERKYPIHDIAHARNALARVSQHGTPEEKAKVHAAVYNKYPSLKQAALSGNEPKQTKKDTKKDVKKPTSAIPKTAAFDVNAFIDAKMKGQGYKYIEGMNKTAAVVESAGAGAEAAFLENLRQNPKKLRKMLPYTVQNLPVDLIHEYGVQMKKQQMMRRLMKSLGLLGVAGIGYGMLKSPGDREFVSTEPDFGSEMEPVNKLGSLDAFITDRIRKTAQSASSMTETKPKPSAAVKSQKAEEAYKKNYKKQWGGLDPDQLTPESKEEVYRKSWNEANMKKTEAFDSSAFIDAKMKGQGYKYIENMNKTAAMDSNDLIENRIKGEGYKNYKKGSKNDNDSETKKDACIKRGMDKNMNLIKRATEAVTVSPSRDMQRITTGDQSGAKYSALDEAIQEKIRNLILENPGMDDDMLHELAAQEGIQPDEAEEFVYSELYKYLSGQEETPSGEAEAAANYEKSAWLKLAAEETVEVSPKQIIEGTKVESGEHHGPAEVSAKIALDHLMETQDYYDKLPTVEETGKKTTEDQKKGMGQLFGDMKYVAPTPEQGEERRKESEKKEAAQVMDRNPYDQTSTASYKNSPASSQNSNVRRIINGVTALG